MADQGVLADVILDGLATIEDVRDRLEATFECIHTLREGRLLYAASVLRDRIDQEACRRAMLCPQYGLSLTERTIREAHPYGSTVAVEEWRQLICPIHGEV